MAELISIEELSKKLNKSVRTLQQWVAIGRATAFNMDTHRRDGGYVFSSEEVARLNGLYAGLTAKEAARRIGITPQYLNTLANNGDIPFEIRQIGNREQRFYGENQCEQLRNRLDAKKHKKNHSFGKKIDCYNNGARLFTEVKLDETNGGLIVDTNPIKILNERGYAKYREKLSMSPWPEIKYQVKKGFIDFKFPMPSHFKHLTYSMIRSLIESLGAVNVQVFETDQGDYFVRCRSGTLSFKDGDELRKHLVSGNLIASKDSLKLVPDQISKYVTFEGATYQVVKNKAASDRLSFDEALNAIILDKKYERPKLE